ncbi:MAG TPA: hypothetical protein VL947_04800, partial [Cytophagales bacterium]|nr:hypothetical protein [Cytophagales bacterium]
QKEWGQYNPHLAKYTQNILDRMGIINLTNSYAKEVTDEGIYLSDGTFLRSRIIIHALGKNTVPLKGLKHLSLNSFKKIDTDANLNARGYENIWCGGDVSLVVKPNSQDYCPPDAPLWAIRQGNTIGKNIKRAMNRQAPEKFGFSGLGHVYSLGIGKGVVELYDITLWGWMAYLARIILLFYFFPAKGRLLGIWWRHLFAPKLPDISQESMKFTKFSSDSRNRVIKRRDLIEKRKQILS